MSDYDCRGCGACCCSPAENRAQGIADWVVVEDDEPLLRNARLVRRFVVYNAEGKPFLRMDKDFRCAALRGTVGRAVECVLYDARPAPCRDFAPGSERCLIYRKEKGVDA